MMIQKKETKKLRSVWSIAVLFAPLLAAMLLCAACEQSAGNASGQGEKPEETLAQSIDPKEPPAGAKEISSAADLEKIDRGGVYKLTDDITVPETLGEFNGEFYGCGKTITITGGKGGLFTKLVPANGTTKLATSKVAVYDLNVKITGIKTDGNIGGIADYIENALIENCTVEAAITLNATGHNNSAGGIVGTMGNNSTVRYCKASGTITIEGKNNGLMVYAGGIAGYSGTPGLAGNSESGCVIERSSWSGSVNIFNEGYPYAGGIVGYNYTGALVKQCYSSGTVKARGGSLPYAGGIAGYNSGYGSKPSTVENCYSEAVVTAESLSRVALAGGIAGANAAGARISKCYARGAVTARVEGNGAENIGSSIGPMLAANAGGIAGAQYVTRTTEPEITACAALNLSVTGADTTSGAVWNIYRISGAGSAVSDTGVFKNNIAWSSMTITTHAEGWYKNASGKDGEDCEQKPAQSVYAKLGWDFSSVWRMENGYPVLTNKG
jgi:hypothetical protein